MVVVVCEGLREGDPGVMARDWDGLIHWVSA